MYIYYIFILVLCALGSYGADYTATFRIGTTTQQDAKNAVCDLKGGKKTITITENSSLRVEVESPYHIQKSLCFMHRDRLKRIYETPRDDDNNRDAWFMEVPNISKEKQGLWSCELKFGYPSTSLQPYDGNGYTYVYCNASVRVIKKTAGLKAFVPLKTIERLEKRYVTGK